MCKSLETGKIPVSWRRGTINVIPKGGDLSDPGNWRPITQTSIFAKLLEKLVHERFLDHLTRNNIILIINLVSYQADQLNWQFFNF